MRQHLLRFKWAVIPLAVVVVVLAWTRMYRTINPGGSPAGGAYYYDLSSGDVFIAPVDASNIVTGPSGSEAVKAAVYACGTCEEEARRFVAYFEKVTPEAVEQMDLPIAERTNPGAIDNGMWVSIPEVPPQWVAVASPQAQAIRDAPFGRCASSDGQAVRCIP